MAKKVDHPPAAATEKALKEAPTEKPVNRGYDTSSLHSSEMTKAIQDNMRYGLALVPLKNHIENLYKFMLKTRADVSDKPFAIATLDAVEKKYPQSDLMVDYQRLEAHKKKGKSKSEALSHFTALVGKLEAVAKEVNSIYTALEKEEAQKAAAAAKVAEAAVARKGGEQKKGDRPKKKQIETPEAAGAYFAAHEAELREEYLISYDYEAPDADAEPKDKEAFVKKMNWASRAVRDLPEVQGALASLGIFTIDTARSVVGKDKVREFKYMSKLYETALTQKLQPTLQNKYKLGTALTVAMNQFRENQYEKSPRIETVDEAAEYLRAHLDELKQIYLIDEKYQIPDTKNISTEDEKRLIRMARSKRAQLKRARELTALLPKKFDFKNYRTELVAYAEAHQDTPALVGKDSKTPMHKLIKAVHTERALDEYQFTLDEARTLAEMTKNKYFASSRVDPEAKRALQEARDERIKNAYPEALAYLREHQQELTDAFLIGDHFNLSNRTNGQIVWQAEKAQDQMQYVAEINDKLGTDVLKLDEAKKLVKKLPAGEKDVPVTWIYQAALKKATDAGLKHDAAITAAVMARNRYLRAARAERAVAKPERAVNEQELKQAEQYVRQNADQAKEVGLVPYNFDVEDLLKRPGSVVVDIAESWKSGLPEAQKMSAEVEYMVPEVAGRQLAHAPKGLVPAGVKMTPENKVFFGTIAALQKKQTYSPLQIEVGAVLNRNRLRRKSAVIEAKVHPQTLDEWRSVVREFYIAQDEISAASKRHIDIKLSPDERVEKVEKTIRELIDDAMKIVENGNPFAVIEETAIEGSRLEQLQAEINYRTALQQLLCAEIEAQHDDLEWVERALPSGKIYILKREGVDLDELWKKEGDGGHYVETEWSKKEGVAADAVYAYLCAIRKTQSEMPDAANVPDDEYSERLEKAVRMTPEFISINDLLLKDKVVFDFIKANGGTEYEYELIKIIQDNEQDAIKVREKVQKEAVKAETAELEKAGGVATELPADEAVAEVVEAATTAKGGTEAGPSAEEQLVEQATAAEAEAALAREATPEAATADTDEEDDGADEEEEVQTPDVDADDDEEELAATAPTAQEKAAPTAAPRVESRASTFQEKYRAYEFTPEGMRANRAVKNMARQPLPNEEEAKKLLIGIQLSDEVKQRMVEYATAYTPAPSEQFDVQAFIQLLDTVQQAQQTKK